MTSRPYPCALGGADGPQQCLEVMHWSVAVLADCQKTTGSLQLWAPGAAESKLLWHHQEVTHPHWRSWWLYISDCCIIWESTGHNKLCYSFVHMFVALLATALLCWKWVKFTYVKMSLFNRLCVLCLTGWLYPLPTDRRCELCLTHIILITHLYTLPISNH